MSRIIGYVRVSTADQSLDLQRNALADLDPVEIVEDVMSGARADRPGLAKAIDMLEPGDTLAVWKLDRLGRSMRQLIDTAEAIKEKEANLRSLTEAFDTGTPGGRMFFHILGTVAEFERETIRERVHAGMKAAKKAGKHIGRRSKMTAARTDEARRMLAGGKSWSHVCTVLQITPPTLSRALARFPKED